MPGWFLTMTLLHIKFIYKSGHTFVFIPTQYHNTGCLKKKHLKEMCDFLTLKMLPLALALIRTKNRHLFDPLVKSILEMKILSIMCYVKIKMNCQWKSCCCQGKIFLMFCDNATKIQTATFCNCAVNTNFSIILEVGRCKQIEQELLCSKKHRMRTFSIHSEIISDFLMNQWIN